mmetsp:Transcript_11205/g.21336  ORF Transcript_11205/g.21336 Transcript_11205/m.21336 type:complete len:153 (-) Transcript_11205:915-1373(-)
MSSSSSFSSSSSSSDSDRDERDRELSRPTKSKRTSDPQHSSHGRATWESDRKRKRSDDGQITDNSDDERQAGKKVRHKQSKSKEHKKVKGKKSKKDKSKDKKKDKKKDRIKVRLFPILKWISIFLVFVSCSQGLRSLTDQVSTYRASKTKKT